MDQLKTLVEFKEYYEIQEQLDDQEIQSIIEDASNNDYSNFDPLNTFGVKTRIIHAREGLILIYGNDFFGYDHICKRHFGSPIKPYFDRHKNPSIFPWEIGPVNLLSYAEKVYKPEFLEEKEKVDIYKGKVDFNRSEGSFELKLVTYKNTGIIISMYPVDRKNGNKLNMFRFKYSFTECSNTPDIIYQVKFFDPKTEEHFILKQIVYRGFKLVKAFIEYKNREFNININNLPKEESFKFKPVYMIGVLDFRVNSVIEKRAIEKFHSLKSKC